MKVLLFVDLAMGLIIVDPILYITRIKSSLTEAPWAALILGKNYPKCLALHPK
jgi:hypothetical protein